MSIEKKAEKKAESEVESIESVERESEALTAWPYRMGLAFYKAAISTFFAAGGLVFLKKKYETGLAERMGNFGPDIPRNALWIHAVSVGEVQSAVSLIDAARTREQEEDSLIQRAGRCNRLQLQEKNCILSTVTTTGRIMAEKLAARKVNAMIYSPWDTPRFVKRALDTLAPKAYIAMETERWPTMLSELHARKIPAFLVNGRLSSESAQKLRGQKTFWRGVLCCFDRLLVRFESDKELFLSLSVPEEKIVVTGDCKIDAMFARRNEMKKTGDVNPWRHLRRENEPPGSSPLFLAGSTHEGEDEVVLAAFEKVREMYPRSRLVIVPRHPQRALYVVAAALPYGETELFTDRNPSGHEAACKREAVDWDIAVVGKIGVLFELYSVVDAAFVGGSLVPKGGQNIMEPALFGIPLTHGPNMDSFPNAARMDALGAAQTVENASQLAKAWSRAMDPVERTRFQKASREYFASVGGAGPRSWDVIKQFLAEEKT
ncbi:MAG: 3-deoxy-D-manno-octulosonic acid transferase [Synergistaceae bacterium]|jgi:3-deoxy-D-manno-octulosonic-acid transferase|nr:3-deoxy-D-manno-octulosonic acid transferase [Synergistaceae bacterium]